MGKKTRRTPPGTDRDLVEDRIRATLDSIPPGQVATYGQVALEAGLPGRARLVGHFLRQLPSGSALPWQRVIGAGGRLSLDSTSPSGRQQIARLKREGIEFSASHRIDLKRFGWQPE